MQTLGTLEEANDKVRRDIEKLFTQLTNLTTNWQSLSVESGIDRLRVIRTKAYEELNQIQHEFAILRAAQMLGEELGAKPPVVWSWNPRQTGGHGEPDLRATGDGKVILSAEVTTSEKPQGVIDTRMRKTLAKLAQMEGCKFYIVTSQAMARRAETKIKNNGWLIKVRLIETPPSP